VLDLGLPEMDGFEVARRLRQEASCQHTVIIAVTGYGQPQDHQRSRVVGINHHLLKPADPDVLLALLSGSHVAPQDEGRSPTPPPAEVELAFASCSRD
jgi:CheY-like chemotaxis protein